MDKDAFYGAAGDYVKARAPQMEASPAAVLSQLMVLCGNAFGSGPYLKVGKDLHHTNEYVAVVGDSSIGRKGMSLSEARSPFERVGPDAEYLFKLILRFGVSTTEGLMYTMRDPSWTTVKGKVIQDEGGQSTLCAVESEMSKLLKRGARDDSTITELLRQLFDGGKCGNISRLTNVTVSNPHFSLIGHITPEDLRRYLSESAQADGFGNRFLWVWAQSTRLLPEGGLDLPEAEETFCKKLQAAVAHAQLTGEMKRDEEARRLWLNLYPRLRNRPPGLFGKMTSRGDVHVCRLAMIYALLDESSEIRYEHLLAAWALWTYSVDTVRFIFGDKLGYPEADVIRAGLRAAGPDGLRRTDISVLFGGNKSQEVIARALQFLLDQDLAFHQTVQKERGAPAELWYAKEPAQ
jgi:hypothetical protein